MYINFFVLVIILGFIFWLGTWAGTKYGYNARHHIDLLWKEILAMTWKRKKLRMDESGDTYSSIFLKEISDRKNLIIVLLDLYFDPQNEEDAEFMRMNHPETSL